VVEVGLGGLLGSIPGLRRLQTILPHKYLVSGCRRVAIQVATQDEGQTCVAQKLLLLVWQRFFLSFCFARGLPVAGHHTIVNELACLLKKKQGLGLANEIPFGAMVQLCVRYNHKLSGLNVLQNEDDASVGLLKVLRICVAFTRLGEVNIAPQF